jgi:carboxyl-terminal processing protease
MRGKPGTPIVLTIKKEGIETPIDFHLIRENIKIKNIQYAGLIPPNIGYIRIAHFAQKAGKEVAKVIDSLKAVGAVKFIVDLRSNPGGLLTEAVEVADNFLDKSKLVVFTKGRNPSAISEYYTTTDSKIESSPLIVLVNRNSASASEIVAGAIQDWEVGLVVGDTTFGKGSVQKIVPLEMGALKLTTAMYYTPSGRCINRSDTFQFLIRNLTLGKKFYTLGRRKRELISVGSIAPDIALPPVKSLSGLLYTPKNLPPSFLIIATRKTIIRNFASKYVREHPELEEDFEVDSVMIEEFKSFLIEKEIKFKDSEFDSAVPIIVERLKEKISEAQWGTKGKYRAILSNDPWIKRSIELLSEANTLDELFKKVETKNERRN